jgi:hypothetical protein
MRSFLALATFVAFLTSIVSARADWLDDVWSKSTTLNGNPAITVHPDGVSVVLPAEALHRAFQEHGMTAPQALQAFLDRYSPKCSSVLDLNVPRRNLTVELRLQVATSPEAAPAQTYDEMLSAMETLKIAPPAGGSSKGTGRSGHARVPRMAQAFITLPERYEFSVDYAPDTVAHCVTPEDPVS